MKDLRLFLVKANDYNRDEYNWFVICAENKTEAENIILKQISDYLLSDWLKNKPNFIEIWISDKTIEKWIILGSFYAW